VASVSSSPFSVHPGPFSVQPDGATINLNPQAWNRWANVVYLESPPGVGFSYGTNNNYSSTDASTAADNYAFLQGFFAEYPEFSTQRFFITGEVSDVE
jgi:carboxypeptidase C (cathepsin A)